MTYILSSHFIITGKNTVATVRVLVQQNTNWIFLNCSTRSWSAAGIVGPVGIASLRKDAMDSAMLNLADKIDATSFEAAFGAGKAALPALIEAKTVTIAGLMDIAPAGTIDPTPMLYTSTMYGCAGLLGIALVSNALIRPVHPKHHMRSETLQRMETQQQR